MRVYYEGTLATVCTVQIRLRFKSEGAEGRGKDYILIPREITVRKKSDVKSFSCFILPLHVQRRDAFLRHAQIVHAPDYLQRNETFYDRGRNSFHIAFFFFFFCF